MTSSSLKGKVAIVTGSSAGLGEAIAFLLASRGANITYAGRDKDRLQSAVTHVADANGGNQDRYLAIQCDLRDRNVREEIIEQTVKKFGRLDILVANAGTGGTTLSFLDDSEETYHDVIDTNLKAVFFLIQKAVPYLEQTKGTIVNISSIVSSIAVPHGVVYSLSKAGLDHLTRCLAVDLGAKGIRVNSVNPGYFPTLFLRATGNIDAINAYIGASEVASTPLKGRKGVVEDVAQTVGFLVSDEAVFVTGEHIKVDGARSFVGLGNSGVEKIVPK